MSSVRIGLSVLVSDVSGESRCSEGIGDRSVERTDCVVDYSVAVELHVIYLLLEGGNGGIEAADGALDCSERGRIQIDSGLLQLSL